MLSTLQLQDTTKKHTKKISGEYNASRRITIDREDQTATYLPLLQAPLETTTAAAADRAQCEITAISNSLQRKPPHCTQSCRRAEIYKAPKLESASRPPKGKTGHCSDSRVTILHWCQWATKPCLGKQVTHVPTNSHNLRAHCITPPPHIPLHV